MRTGTSAAGTLRLTDARRLEGAGAPGMRQSAGAGSTPLVLVHQLIAVLQELFDRAGRGGHDRSDAGTDDDLARVGERDRQREDLPQSRRDDGEVLSRSVARKIGTAHD